MNYIDLENAAQVTIQKIDNYVKRNGSSNSLDSIRNQMVFIRDSAKKNKHPVTMLKDDNKFTYSIIASRELASPEELELYDYIVEVSRIMDNMPH